MMSHMMLELSTAHLSSRTLDALSENSIETVASYEKASRWLGRVGYFIAITGLEEDLPADLEFCIQFAEQRGADWIMFDNDAEAVAALPFYH